MLNPKSLFERISTSSKSKQITQSWEIRTQFEKLNKKKKSVQEGYS